MATTDDPLAFFITFSCHGTWLHGDPKGSVDRDHNMPGTPFLAPDVERQLEESQKTEPYSLDAKRREVALKAIVEIAMRKAWKLWAAHIRSNHVHIVVSASGSVERVMNDIKAAISRRLNKAFPEEKDQARWTRHGSTRYLWRDDQVEAAVHCTVESQGTPMTVFDARTD